MQGWIWAQQGHAKEAIVQIREGIARCDTIGAQMDRPHQFAVLAEAYALNDQLDDGLAVLEEALQRVEKTGNRYYEAELYRLKGELLLAQKGKRQRATGKNYQSLTPNSYSPVRFIEGFDTKDLQEARALLTELS